MLYRPDTSLQSNWFHLKKFGGSSKVISINNFFKQPLNRNVETIKCFITK